MVWCVALLVSAGGPSIQPAFSQNFSDWIEASGVTQVQYRWKQNDIKGCEIEYRNTQDRGQKKFKTRIVYQTDGDEHHQANTVLSFTDNVSSKDDHVSACTVITDITVTRF